MEMLWRLLSFIWPVRVERLHGRHMPLDVMWDGGKLVVNSPNANQSYGSLHRVMRMALRDLDLAEDPPRDVLILGFGAGSVASILRKEMQLNCHIVGVEGDPIMLLLARKRFRMDQMAELALVEMDAFDFVREHVRTYDLVIVDLFKDLEFTQGLEGAEFMGGLKRLTRSGGRVLINTVVNNDELLARSAHLAREMRHHYSTVKEQRLDGINLVFTGM